MKKKVVYEAPMVEVIKVTATNLCTTSGDPTVTNPPMGWEARNNENWN